MIRIFLFKKKSNEIGFVDLRFVIFTINQSNTYLILCEKNRYKI